MAFKRSAVRSRLSPPEIQPLVDSNGFFNELNKQKTGVRASLSPPPVNSPWNCVPGLFYFVVAIIQEVNGCNLVVMYSTGICNKRLT